jgi:hypothetical protein
MTRKTYPKTEVITQCLTDILSDIVSLAEVLGDPEGHYPHGVSYEDGEDATVALIKETQRLSLEKVNRSNHLQLRIEAQKDRLRNSLKSFYAALTEEGPYFSDPRHVFAFEVRDNAYIRICINNVGDHISAVRVEEAARRLAGAHKWIGHLAPKGKRFDVKGHQVFAHSAQEALHIYSALMFPENPFGSIGLQRVTVLERHEDQQMDELFFQDSP